MRRSLRKLTRNDTGSASVEMVMWMPLFIIIIGMVFDATLLMTGQTKLYSVAGDASRLVALGRFTTSEAEDFVTGFAAEGETYTVDVSATTNQVTTSITRPFSDFGGLGILTSLPVSIGAQARYRIEPTI